MATPVMEPVCAVLEKAAGSPGDLCLEVRGTRDAASLELITLDGDFSFEAPHERRENTVSAELRPRTRRLDGKVRLSSTAATDRS